MIVIYVQIINAFCVIPKMKPKFLQMNGHNTLLRRKECIWKSKEASNIIQHINVVILTQCSVNALYQFEYLTKPCNKKNSLWLWQPLQSITKPVPQVNSIHLKWLHRYKSHDVTSGDHKGCKIDLFCRIHNMSDESL